MSTKMCLDWLSPGSVVHLTCTGRVCAILVRESGFLCVLSVVDAGGPPVIYAFSHNVTVRGLVMNETLNIIYDSIWFSSCTHQPAMFAVAGFPTFMYVYCCY